MTIQQRRHRMMSQAIDEAGEKTQRKAGTARDRFKEGRAETTDEGMLGKIDLGDAKLLEAQEWSAKWRALIIGQPSPSYDFQIHGLPWGPVAIDEYIDRHIEAPEGLISKTMIKFQMLGSPTDPAIWNMLAWFSGRKSNGKGIWPETLGYWNWLDPKSKVQQGIPTVTGINTICKPNFWDLNRTVMTHTVEYLDGTQTFSWNGVEFECHKPIGRLTVDKHGLYLALGGEPAHPDEQSCIGVVFEEIVGRIFY